MPDSYLVLKTLHIVGVILFLGNISVTGWWKAMADRTGDPAIVAFAQRQVIATDWVFTLGGAVLLFAAGMASSMAWTSKARRGSGGASRCSRFQD